MRRQSKGEKREIKEDVSGWTVVLEGTCFPNVDAERDEGRCLHIVHVNSSCKLARMFADRVFSEGNVHISQLNAHVILQQCVRYVAVP